MIFQSGIKCFKKIKKKNFQKFASKYLAIEFVLYIGNIINGKFSDFQIFAFFGKKIHV